MYIYIYYILYDIVYIIYTYIYQQGFPYWRIGGNPLTSQKFAHSQFPHLEQFFPLPKINSLPTK